MKSYDDERYLQWHHEFNGLVAEFLDTEGNDNNALQSEFDQAVENALANLEDSE